MGSTRSPTRTVSRLRRPRDGARRRLSYVTRSPSRPSRIRAHVYGIPRPARARSHHGHAFGLEGPEEHAVAAGVVDGVEPDVRLEEAAQPRQARATAARPRRYAVHDERDEGDVGETVDEDVRPRPRREEVAHGVGVDRLVHEGQVAPHLVEDHGWPERRGLHRVAGRAAGRASPRGRSTTPSSHAARRTAASVGSTSPTASRTTSDGGPDHDRQAPTGSTRRRRTTKLGIVGAGAVGATLAYAALDAWRRAERRALRRQRRQGARRGARPQPRHPVRPDGARAGARTTSRSSPTPTSSSSRPAPSRSPASPGSTSPSRPSESCGRSCPRLVEVAPDAVHVMVTNPVDVVTYAALQVVGAAAGAALRLGHRPRLVAAALPARRAHRRRGPERARLRHRRARRLRAAAVVVGVDRLGAAAAVAHLGRAHRARRGGPQPHRDRRRAVGLPRHRGQGRDELRDRPRRHPDHRGGRSTTSAASCPSRRSSTTTTASATSACRCRRSSTPAGSATGSRCR